MKNEQKLKKLQNHSGRFMSVTVNRVKTGKVDYNVKVRRITNKTVILHDVKNNQVFTVPIANIETVR